MSLERESDRDGPGTFMESTATRTHRNGLMRTPPRGQRAGRTHTGVSREPGSPCRLHPNETGSWDPVDQNPGPARAHSRAHGSEPQGARWYRQAKATKCGGTGGRESERSIVPMKLGNQPEGPSGGKGKPGQGPERGQDEGETALHDRLNETRTDSETGAGDARSGTHQPVPSHRRSLASRGVETHP